MGATIDLSNFRKRKNLERQKAEADRLRDATQLSERKLLDQKIGILECELNCEPENRKKRRELVKLQMDWILRFGNEVARREVKVLIAKLNCI